MIYKDNVKYNSFYNNYVFACKFFPGYKQSDWVNFRINLESHTYFYQYICLLFAIISVKTTNNKYIATIIAVSTLPVVLILGVLLLKKNCHHGKAIIKFYLL